jgi:hypothetical protein
MFFWQVSEDIGVKDQQIEEGKKIPFNVVKARPTFPTRLVTQTYHE